VTTALGADVVAGAGLVLDHELLADRSRDRWPISRARISVAPPG